MMLRGLMKVAGLAATLAVVLPYTTALICNLAYGWPQVPNKYRRAFSPRKVYALNFRFIQSMMVSLRYATLFLQWRAFYKTATASQIMKDRTYGQNGQKLDLYFPMNHSSGEDGPRPVVMFAYGGTWGSGNKKMYGLLCSAIANKLNVIVCCPNQSTFPHGYVDDMVQDLVDCLRWLYRNIEQYNGVRDQILLLGHSSGAHLCTMTMLQLIHDELHTSTAHLHSISPSSLCFMERHFADGQPSAGTGDVDSNDGRHSSGSSGSFQILNGHDNGVQNEAGVKNDSMSLSASQFEVLDTKKFETELSEDSMLDSEIPELTQSEISGVRYRGTNPDTTESAPYVEGATGGEKGEVTGDGSEDEDGSVITVKEGEGDTLPTWTVAQPSATELRKSVKAIIGLAGVYHIGDHFIQESKRGIEDISRMTRAMRGPENFDRFSPTHIVSTLTAPLSFPKTVLLHGTEDYVVPLSSANRFVEQLQRVDADVTLRIIPSCCHHAICLDLMNPDMTFHKTVMSVIEDTANSVFS